MNKPKQQEVTLGDLAKDSVTGFTGVAVAICEWLHGCARVTLQPQKLDKDGKVRSSETFDILQLQVVKSAKVKAKSLRAGAALNTGGPADDRTALRKSKAVV